MPPLGIQIAPWRSHPASAAAHCLRQHSTDLNRVKLKSRSDLQRRLREAYVSPHQHTPTFTLAPRAGWFGWSAALIRPRRTG
jgi:hypothetical protein